MVAGLMWSSKLTWGCWRTGRSPRRSRSSFALVRSTRRVCPHPGWRLRSAGSPNPAGPAAGQPYCCCWRSKPRCSLSSTSSGWNKSQLLYRTTRSNRLILMKPPSSDPVRFCPLARRPVLDRNKGRETERSPEEKQKEVRRTPTPSCVLWMWQTTVRLIHC